MNPGSFVRERCYESFLGPDQRRDHKTGPQDGTTRRDKRPNPIWAHPRVRLDEVPLPAYVPAPLGPTTALSQGISGDSRGNRDGNARRGPEGQTEEPAPELCRDPVRRHGD